MNNLETDERQSQPSAELQLCPLCEIWARMPYAKRWSTPTSVVDTESALVIGYWLGIRYGNIKLCERHGNLIFDLNRKEIPLLLPNTPQNTSVSHGSAQPFKLGPEPFTNENVAILTQPSPVPQIQPNINVSPVIDPIKSAINASLKPQMDFTQLALEAAKMPPVEGKRITYCPVCGKEITLGDVHACQSE